MSDSEPLGLWMTVHEVTLYGALTKKWDIYDRHGSVLGQVKFFGRWRQYAFFPNPSVIFNQGCLTDLATFLDERTKEWRTSKRKIPAIRTPFTPRTSQPS